MAPPIFGSVPPPNSSISRRVFPLACLIMFFMFIRWLEYVLRSSAMLCSSPISIMILANTPAFDLSLIGTEMPHCNMYCTSPTVFRHTDLPPAFGPDIISIRFSSVRVISSGTTVFPCLFSERSRSGWRASIQSICGRRSTVGSMAFISFAVSAFART